MSKIHFGLSKVLFRLWKVSYGVCSMRFGLSKMNIYLFNINFGLSKICFRLWKMYFGAWKESFRIVWVDGIVLYILRCGITKDVRAMPLCRPIVLSFLRRYQGYAPQTILSCFFTKVVGLRSFVLLSFSYEEL